MTLPAFGRRLLFGLIVVLVAYTVTFLLLNVLPGDPVEIMLGGGQGADVDPALVEAARVRLGYDQPLFVRFFEGLFGLVRGDLGVSAQTGRPVTEVLLEALPNSVQLAAVALAFGLMFGAGIAILGNIVRWRWLSNFLLAIPPIGVSMPTFWVGLLLIQLVSFQWRILPAFGTQGWQSLVLPALTWSVPLAAIIGQVLARGMRDASAQPYIDTARAKGASWRRVNFSHVLRNAAIPTLTVAGIMVGTLINGAVVVETVFGRNGIGRTTVDAVTLRDFPLVQGVVVLATVIFVLASLFVDVLYPVLDPRLRARRAAPKAA